MASLSNFFRPRDPLGSGQVECRQVQRPEVESALRLILADNDGLAGDEAVLDFLAFAMQRKIDVNQTWVAIAGNRVVWALLPITSPGRTMLLFSPNRLPGGTPLRAVKQLTDAVCAHWGSHDMHMAQFLLESQQREICDLYTSCGFETLAELLYLVKPIHQAVDFALPAGMHLLPYEPATHALFAKTILRSYENSLDCPALNGRRGIEDIIAGHKAAGHFDPFMWHLLMEKDQPMGVVILAPSQNHDAVELVYLGLAPEARGRGVGDCMMRLAINTVLKQQRSELSLAVDSRNTPALRLYYRHGMHRVGSRLALVRDLIPARRTPVV